MLHRITLFFDTVAKWGGGFIILLLVLSTIFPPISKATKAFSAWRFGAVGVVKYQLGTESSEKDFPERKPTRYGKLYLLSPNPIGNREWSDLKFGDILQAKGPKNLRLEDGCGDEDRRDCGSSPRIFTLDKGECVIVLARLYEDNKPKSDLNNVEGGWLRVGSTSCGLFN